MELRFSLRGTAKSASGPKIGKCPKGKKYAENGQKRHNIS